MCIKSYPKYIEKVILIQSKLGLLDNITNLICLNSLIYISQLFFLSINAQYALNPCNYITNLICNAGIYFASLHIISLTHKIKIYIRRNNLI